MVILAAVLCIAALLCAIALPVLIFLRGREPCLAASALVNSALGGYGRESLSSRLGRTGEMPRVKAWIDRLAKDHCYTCAMREAGFVVWLMREKSDD